jgi:hypothetical protein
MDSDNKEASRAEAREDDRSGILRRIEERLERLLSRSEDDWHAHAWAPEESPFAYYSPGDPSPRFFGGPRADAPGWDPGLAGPRFDRINSGAVGMHGVDPVSSFYGAQQPLIGGRSSAREYYLLMRALGGSDTEKSLYADYRRRKIDNLDREYADYRRDQQERFDRDFESWRGKRKGPPRAVQEPVRSEAGADEPTTPRQ